MTTSVYKNVMRKFPATILIFCLVIAFWTILSSDFTKLDSQPFPDSQSYFSEAVQIARGNGFVIDFDERISSAKNLIGVNETYPSRYPPGYSLILAPFVVAFGNVGVEVGVKVVTFLMLVTATVIAKRLSGYFAATLTAATITTSPFFQKSATLVMSDAFGALLCLLAILAMIEITRCGPQGNRARNLSIILGMICGYAVISRIALLFTIVAAAIIFVKRRNLRWITLGFAPFLLLLGILQYLQFGSPFRTGYSLYASEYVEFSISHLTQTYLRGERAFIFPDLLQGKLMTWTCPCDRYGPIGKAPNIVFYPATLSGLYWIFMPPLLGVLGFYKLLKSLCNETYRFMALLFTLNTITMVFYFFQGARLVAPSALILIISGSVLVADLATKARKSARSHRLRG